MHFAKLALSAAALLCSSTAFAGAPAWTVSESSGAVNILHAGTSKVANRGGALVIGDVVVTGARGRAVLVRGQEFLVVSPNSRISIADPANTGGLIQIVQNWGSAIFKIEKKTEKHFAVKTPYLAAVVKGTTFNITVDDKGARVQVTEGRVEVATPDGRAVSMVLPGEVGLVNARDTMRLTIQGLEKRNIDSPDRAAAGAGAEVKATETSSASEATNIDQNAGSEQSSAAGSEARSTVAAVETQVAPPTEPVRITSPVGEGEVKLGALTGGLVQGDSSLIAGVRPVQMALASAAQSQTSVADGSTQATPAAAELAPPVSDASSSQGQPAATPPTTNAATAQPAAPDPATTTTPPATVAATTPEPATPTPATVTPPAAIVAVATPEVTTPTPATITPPATIVAVATPEVATPTPATISPPATIVAVAPPEVATPTPATVAPPATIVAVAAPEVATPTPATIAPPAAIVAAATPEPATTTPAVTAPTAVAAAPATAPTTAPTTATPTNTGGSYTFTLGGTSYTIASAPTGSGATNVTLSSSSSTGQRVLTKVTVPSFKPPTGN